MSIIKKIATTIAATIVNLIKKDIEFDKKLYKKHPTLFKIIYGFLGAFLLLAIVLNVTTGHYDRMKKFNESKHAPAVELSQLTTEEKVKEFDYMCRVLNENMPSLSYFKERFGIDFNENYDNFRADIEATKDNFEYYCTLKAILNYVPSCHTAIPHPDYKYMGFGYNSHRILAEFNIKNYTDSWKEYIYSIARENYSENYFTAFYFTGDGEYIVCDTIGAASLNSKYAGAVIRSVDGVSADEYALEPSAYSPLCFDSIHNKVYRDTLLFSLESGYGEKKQLLLELEDGTAETLDVYCGETVDIICSNGQYLANNGGEEPEEEPAEYFIHTDEERNLTYLRADEVDDEREQLKNDIINITTDNLILDLRGNGGGFPHYFFEYLYKPIVNTNTEHNSTYYIPYGKENKKQIYQHSPLVDLMYLSQNPITYADESFLPSLYKNCRYAEFSNDISIEAGNFRDWNIYVIIGSGTASAADEMAVLFKEETDAVLLGQSPTLGEGQGGSYIEMALPESKLTMRYYPALAFNADGTNNSVYGTEPDIYVPVTYERFSKLYDMQKDGDVNTNVYETRLKYDEILLRTIEEIENDS